MPPSFYFNEGTGRSYIDATRIVCSQLNAANVSANSVSSASLSGGAQNGLGPQVVDYNASTTSSNSYAIINKPVLAQVATTGSYLNLANVPNFANVAFTNNYNSLSNLPALSQVAYTGAYAALSGKPANLSSFTNDLTTFGNSLTITGNASVSKSLTVSGNVTANLISLPNANFTGQYSELKGTPNAAYTASSNVGNLVASTIAANTLSVSANVDYPVTITQNFSSGVNGYSHAITALNPAQSNGEAFMMQFGQTAGTYGTSYFGHVNQGPTSSNNYATVGLYGQDRILNVTGNRQVGINTTTPQYNLDVAGNVHVSSLLTTDGGLYSGKTVYIAYNAGTYGMLCYGPATMASTQFVTPTGYPCPTVTYTNGGPANNAPWPANTVTTTMNFQPNSSQATLVGAAIQIRDDGNPFIVNGGYVQPSAYMSFQTGATERLLIGNSGQVTVPGTLVVGGVSRFQSNLLVNVNDNTCLIADAGNNSRLGFVKQSGQSPKIVAASGNPILLGISNQGDLSANISSCTVTEGFRLHSNGYVGINNTSPSYPLDVSGTARCTTMLQTNAYSSRYTMSSDQALTANTSATVTNWNSVNNQNTSGAGISLSSGVFTTSMAGIYAIQLHLRFNATAAENAGTLLSTGGAVYSSGTRLAVSDTTVYDASVNFTGYLASGDGWNVQAYTTVTNSILASFSNIPSFIQITCLQRSS